MPLRPEPLTALARLLDSMVNVVDFGNVERFYVIDDSRSAANQEKNAEIVAKRARRLDFEITHFGAQAAREFTGRLVAELPERFARFSLSNTGLPTGDHPINEAFHKWRAFSQEDPEFDTGYIVNLFGHGDLTEAEIEAYRAPFPSDEYKAGARQFPVLVPTVPDDPASAANRAAWKVLTQWHKPALMCFSDADPIMAGGDKPFLKLVPGTQNQPHITLSGRHFIQEEDGETWARAVVSWIMG